MGRSHLARKTRRWRTSPLSPRLSGYEYPFDVQTLALTNQRQDLEMAYMHLPAKADRPTVLLLHGKNFNGAYWRQTAEFLAGRG